MAATVHSDEGLNDMVYNRCVGTRYCSNNCPYKVRRFNFFLYRTARPPSLKLMRNPDVTVRSRGVMEKCTYCVQRINQARMEATTRAARSATARSRPPARPPARPRPSSSATSTTRTSRVAQLKAEPRDYGVLADLNTRPRTTLPGRGAQPEPGDAAAGRRGEPVDETAPAAEHH